MRNLLFFGILLFMVVNLSAQEKWRKGEMEIKVTLHSKEEVQQLQRFGFDAEGASADGFLVNVYVTPVELQQIQSAGFDYRISIPDMNEHYKGFWDSQLVPPGYHSYDQIVALADSLAAVFPNICKKVMYGTSVGGRQLAALKISDSVNSVRTVPKVLFDGGIHGDEVGGPENLIRFARDLCTAYGNNPDLTYLIHNREIWIYYMVNPDGRVNMTRVNQNGVDLNRDCGYMWDASGASPAAFSQPESKALRTCFLENKFTIYSSYHSGAETLAYPWSYRPNPSPDNDQLDYLASIYVNYSTYPSLPYGEGYNIMYAINGCTKDFQYGTAGIPGWTMEISANKQPPSNQILLFYNFNKPAMVEMIRRAGYGISGILQDSVTGKPVKAILWANSLFPGYNDPATGVFHKYLKPGTYSIRFTANGYQSKTVSGIQVPDTGSVFIPVILAPDTLRYAFRVMSCQIPGNNFYDVGFTPGCLGAPDNTPYSIGKNGWIIVDMGDTVFNGPGDDLKVYQSGGTPENFICYASTSLDGPWSSLGYGSGTTSFDLGPVSLSKARYIKIMDTGNGEQNVPGAGYDLDAIQMLTPPLIVDFSASDTVPCSGGKVNFTDKSLGNAIHRSWVFQGGTPSVSTQKNPYNILYSSPGYYNVTLTITNGYSSSTLVRTAYIHARMLPSVPDKPSGPVTTYAGTVTQYTTDTIAEAFSYLWDLWPAEAGSISGNFTEGTVSWDSAFLGTAFLKVKEINGCGESDFSDSLAVSVEYFPAGTGSGLLSKGLLISPNPAHDIFRLSCFYSDSGDLEIYSMTGNKVLDRFVNMERGKPEAIDLHGLPAGIYFVKFSGKKITCIQKLIII